MEHTGGIFDKVATVRHTPMDAEGAERMLLNLSKRLEKLSVSDARDLWWIAEWIRNRGTHEKT